MTRRVLTIGNCTYDHGRLASTIRSHFDAEVFRAVQPEEAMKTLAEGRFDLVLVNRVIDADGSQGVDVVRQIKSDPTLAGVPVMLISNFPDAQQQAVEAGAEQGFGKASLETPETVALLASVLGEDTSAS